MDTFDSEHIYSMYFAPRGRERLLALGGRLAHIHLSYKDRLVGIIGDSGSGKSLIVQGIFPGVVLSNDDDAISVQRVMQIRNQELDHEFRSAVYHIDVRFQMAFTQMYEIVDFVKGALEHGRRVIVEHFDLLYPALQVKADLMIGIGEEIIVTRPNLFGPLPKDIYNLVIPTLKKRKMAHSAEDLTAYVLEDIYQIPFRELKVSNSDVRGGFVLNFPKKLEIDLEEVEGEVRKLINNNLSVSYYDDEHIQIGDNIVIPCTGPRIHVRNTSEIEDFRLIKEFKYDPETNKHCIIGLIGRKIREIGHYNQINREED